MKLSIPRWTTLKSATSVEGIQIWLDGCRLGRTRQGQEQRCGAPKTADSLRHFPAPVARFYLRQF
ncbi:hypothetical protein [Geomesophilobacter sediminis]|uniref:hypothetical protein n=1 Tax=Geomesophilobacter sediminis TaxID=2798584 RepID=UPI001F3AA986|nr:hypothetical protein [Geomesophilobacter sediminis]